VINELNNNPSSRRIYLSAWNPQHMHKMALPPCHISAQFYVSNDNELSCHMYQRSVDTFLGLPFNIFSYTALTYILATICGMTPKELIISTGDTHLYLDHIALVHEQLDRNPITPPKLIVNKRIKDIPIEQISVDDFDVVGYFHHNQLKGKMSV
jgi:thymidylate synthase